jgi:hypothetical protein
MIIVAGGDSFIFGAELKDQITGPSNNTYPALLAQHHNIEYYCAAWSGNANSAISRMTMTACATAIKDGKQPIAIVTWTFTNRYEFRFNYNTRQRTSPWHSINAWSILDNTSDIEKEFVNANQSILEHQKEKLNREKEIGISGFAKTFFKHVGDSEYYELYSSLKEILFLQNYFKTNNIPYLFLPADNHFYQHPNYHRQQDEYINALYNQIDWDKWFFFEMGLGPNQTESPRGFYQWAVENKYPIGTTHPLEEAHSAAAELLMENFNELVTQSYKSN